MACAKSEMWQAGRRQVAASGSGKQRWRQAAATAATEASVALCSPSASRQQTWSASPAPSAALEAQAAPSVWSSPPEAAGGPPLLQQNQLCTRTVYALQTGFPGQLQHGAPSAKGCRPHRASLPLLPTIDPTNMSHQLIRALEEACSGSSHLVHTSNAAGELAVAAGHLHEIANPSRPRVAQQEGTAAAR